MSDAPEMPSRRGLFRALAGRAEGPAVPAGAREAAEGFVDAYYARQDPGAAGAFAAGLLRRRLKEEEALAASAGPPGRPRVGVRLEAAEGHDPRAVTLHYRIDVSPATGTPFQVRARLGVALVEGAWAVATLQEGP